MIKLSEINRIMHGGRQGIRTLEWLPITRFPGVRLRPLGQSSADMSGQRRDKFNIELRKRLGKRIC